MFAEGFSAAGYLHGAAIPGTPIPNEDGDQNITANVGENVETCLNASEFDSSGGPLQDSLRTEMKSLLLEIGTELVLKDSGSSEVNSYEKKWASGPTSAFASKRADWCRPL